MIFVGIVAHKTRPYAIYKQPSFLQSMKFASYVTVLCQTMTYDGVFLPNMYLMHSPFNRGCSSARQRIVDFYTGKGARNDDIIVFLDDDLIINNPLFLPRLYDKLLTSVDTHIMGVEGGFVTDNYYTQASTENVEYVSGGWCAIRYSVFKKCEFDPVYDPNYWEDVDLCYQARANGFGIALSANTGLEHPNTGKGDFNVFEKSREAFKRKWHGHPLRGDVTKW